MTRIFNRGELKQVLLTIVASLGEGHGYAIMQELQQRVGHDWRPSPGAIYPALLALEESGLIESAEKDGLRAYRPTEQGRQALGGEAAAPAWQTLAQTCRCQQATPHAGETARTLRGAAACAQTAGE